MDMDIYGVLEQVRRQSPVVHHLTNWVTIYDCAQVVKTLGASPVMAHAPEEVAEMTRIASALVLNIGTLTSELVEAMKVALQAANHKGIPVVLDVCGAGATALRDEKSFELLKAGRIDVLKGNGSEVARLAGEMVRTRGVDSAETGADLMNLAKELAAEHGNVVVITGKEDIVTDGKDTWLVDNGHVMMTRIVGTGCMATSVIGAFAAVEPDLLKAATSALSCYGLAGEIAAEQATGPMNFKERLFDTLATLNRERCRGRLRQK